MVTEKGNNFDQQLERQIVDHFSEISPPEQEVREANPWRRPIGQIAWGFIFATIHLEFFYLQYILPIIGTALLFIGFRSLKNANIAFKTAWVLSIVRLFEMFFGLVYEVTPIFSFDDSMIVFALIGTVLSVALLLTFRSALQKIYPGTEPSPSYAPLIYASIWYVVGFFISLFQFTDTTFLAIVMIIIYIAIAKGIYKISTSLGDEGYFLSNAPVKIGNRAILIGYLTISILVAATCGILSNHLVIDVKAHTLPEMTEARKELVAQGFPEEELQFLSEDAVTQLKGAKIGRVDVGSHLYDARNVSAEIESKTIVFESDDNTIYVFHCFNLIDGNPVWQDGIRFIKDNQAHDLEIIDNGLYFTRNETNHTAQFSRLRTDVGQGPLLIEEIYSESNSDASGTIMSEGMLNDYINEDNVILGAHSFPFFSSNQGCFVLFSYKVNTPSDKFTSHIGINYLHNIRPTLIPYSKVEDRLMEAKQNSLVFDYNHRNVFYSSVITYDSIALAAEKELEEDALEEDIVSSRFR